MVKPPKTMQPEGVDLKKAGRAAGKAFQEDSFRNYMARKIDLQRQQFGLQLPPDPRLQQQQQKEQEEWQQQKQQSSKYKNSNNSSLVPSPSKKKSVTFAEGVKQHDASAETSSTTVHKKKKRKRSGMQSILKKLKRRHGSGYKRSSSKRSSERSSKRRLVMSDPGEEEKGETTASNCKQQLEPYTGSENELDHYQDPGMSVDDLVARALERETREREEAQMEQVMENTKTMEIEQESEDEDEEDTSNENNQENAISFSRRLSTRLKRDRPDLFFFGVVVIVNGYTRPDAETIQRLLQKHGGDLEKYETSRITHVIAEQLSTAKANIYKRMRKPLPVVKPAWIVDSVRAERLLPHGDYLIDEVKDKEYASMRSFFTAKKAQPDSLPVCKTKDDNELDMARKLAAKEYTDMDIGNSSMEARPPSMADEEVPKLLPSDEMHKESSQEGTVSIESHQGNDGDAALRPHKKETTNIVAVGEDVETSKNSLLEPTVEQEHDKNTPTKDLKDQPSIKIRDEVSAQSRKISSGRTDDKYINGRVRTVGTDPHFLQTFFSNSRLSFIGSYKQRTKESPKKQSNRGDMQDLKRFVFHVDMDCFFAAVALRNHPELQNKPVVISHFGKPSSDNGDHRQQEKSTSECATCNYVARKYGIKKGMFIGRARQLCPSLVVLNYDFEGYEEVSVQVATILQNTANEYNGLVEEVSCDESYVELFFDGNQDPYRHAGEVANSLRREILQTTRCSATVGVSTNKFLAKLATDRVKPDGSFVVRDHTELLRHLNLRDLPGIGYRTEPKLAKEGLVCVQDVWDLGQTGQDILARILGQSNGKKIFDFCMGQDDRPVQAGDRKSIGAECNYGVRFDGPYGPDYMLQGLAKEVEKRMEAAKVRGNRVTLKVKQRKPSAPAPPKWLGHGSCYNLSRSLEVSAGPTRHKDAIRDVAMQLLKALKVPTEDIRGMGIVVSKLDNTTTEPGSGGQQAQSLMNWFSHSNQLSKPAKKSTANEREEGEYVTPNDDSQGGPAEPDFANQQPRYSQIDEAILRELPPEIQEELRTGRSDVLPTKGFGGSTNEHDSQSNVEDQEDNDAHETLNLSQDSFEEDNQVVVLDDNDAADNSSVQSENSFSDVALPPLSQIHMSQVDALPSPIRRQIHSKISDHTKETVAEEMSTPSPFSAFARKPSKSRTAQNNGNPRYRQGDVKRFFQLAAVKFGCNTTISPSELQQLPLKMQLQLANNDHFAVGSLSQRKSSRTHGSRAGRSTPAAKIKETNGARRQLDLSSPKSQRSEQSQPLERSAHNGKDNHEPLLNVADGGKWTDIDGTAGSENADHEPGDFYSEDVAPLADFMDENREAPAEAVDQVVQFLCLCIKEGRMTDVVVLLRSIKNRRDAWKNHAYQEILSATVRTCREVEGCWLDVRYI